MGFNVLNIMLFSEFVVDYWIIMIVYFQNISKAIVSIAYGLNHTKEVKNFFSDVTEEVSKLLIGVFYLILALQLKKTCLFS